MTLYQLPSHLPGDFDPLLKGLPGFSLVFFAMLFCFELIPLISCFSFLPIGVARGLQLNQEAGLPTPNGLSGN